MLNSGVKTNLMNMDLDQISFLWSKSKIAPKYMLVLKFKHYIGIKNPLRERSLVTGRGGSFPDFRRSENRPPPP